MRSFAVAIILCCILLGACKEKTKSDIATKKDSEYPLIIDSLKVTKVYDETKWRVYCYRCDDTLTFQKSVKDTGKVYFGSLNLKFDTVNVTKDRMEIYFVFEYKGKVCDDNMIRNSGVRGVVFNNSLDSVLNYISGDEAWLIKETCQDTSHCKSRFVNPLQPEVVRFINEHKTELNPWFYQMAKKKGVLK